LSSPPRPTTRPRELATPPDHPADLSSPPPPHDPARLPPPDPRTRRAARALDGFALALTFLTVIPVRSRGAGAQLRDAAVWFPIVGALVGGLAGAVRFYLEPPFGATVASVLALVALVGVTGALHQDGLADCADGLGVRGGERERRLAVMRDPATGVFGTLALVGWALLLVATLSALSDGEALRALVSAAIVGRVGALVHAAATPPARPDGLGAAFAVTTRALTIASVAAVAGVVLLDGIAAGLATAVVGGAVALATSAWARGAIGGRTGDTLGATVALTEVAACLTLLAFATS
jgi:adenosylcobinamide-GDP ribazoletransferase